MFSVKIKKAIVSDGSRHFEGGGGSKQRWVFGAVLGTSVSPGQRRGGKVP